MDEAAYHAIVSGARKGLFGAAARAGLSLCTPFYRAGLFLDQLRTIPRQVDPPVISVGNLTCGGTGKTPVVAWLTQRLKASGWKPGLLSRGYKGESGVNDEKLVLDALCPSVPHIQQSDRVAAARKLSQQCNILILDDGFQHRRLSRSVDIVLIDALRPWGYGHVLPRGLLREPPQALDRASLIVVTRVDLISDADRQKLEWTIGRFTDAPIATGRFCPTRLVSSSGMKVKPRDLRNVRAAAFCGLGNPSGFAATLNQFGLCVPEELFRFYPDHHRYTEADQIRLAEWAEAGSVDMLVTTRKDLVKLNSKIFGATPVLAVDIAFEPVHRSELFDDVLPKSSVMAKAA